VFWTIFTVVAVGWITAAVLLARVVGVGIRIADEAEAGAPPRRRLRLVRGGR
jgi:hypothetical protein